jgi:hypothetical protein
MTLSLFSGDISPFKSSTIIGNLRRLKRLLYLAVLSTLLADFDFSTPTTVGINGNGTFASTYATDEWLLQETSGSYSNNVGSETLSNTGGLQGQTAVGLFNGADYISRKAWETDSTVANTNYLKAAGSTAGDSNNQDFAFRLIFRCKGPQVSGDYLLAKRSSGSPFAGWFLQWTATDRIRLSLDGGATAATLDTTAAQHDDAAWHEVTGWYDFSANMMYIKTDLSAENSTSTATIITSLSNANSLFVNAYRTGAAEGFASNQVAYAGVSVGANAQAFYDEEVVLPGADPTGLLTTQSRASLISVPVSATHVAHFAPDTLPIGYHSALNGGAGGYGLYCNSAVTNLVPNSETTISWNNTWNTTTLNYGDSPAGFRQSIRLEASGIGQAFFETSIAIAASTEYTWSAWVRSTDGGADTDFRMTLRDETNSTNVADVSHTATSQWQLFTVTGTMLAGAATASTRIISLTASDDIELQFFQLNLGSARGAYIRTSGASSSLVACIYRATGTAGQYMLGGTGELEMVYIPAKLEGAATRYLWESAEPTGNLNRRYTTLQTDATDMRVRQYGYDGAGSLFVSGFVLPNITTLEEFTLVQQWDSTGSLAVVVGADAYASVTGAVAASSSSDIGTFTSGSTATTFTIGGTRSGGSQLDGHVQRIRTWSKERAT